jgi:hypothetical protein
VLRTALALACLALPVGAAERERPAPRWLTDLDQARRRAKASGKPLFVVFRCEH